MPLHRLRQLEMSYAQHLQNPAQLLAQAAATRLRSAEAATIASHLQVQVQQAVVHITVQAAVRAVRHQRAMYRIRVQTEATGAALLTAEAVQRLRQEVLPASHQDR